MAETTAIRLFRNLQSPICASCLSGIYRQTPSALRPFSHSTRGFAKASGSNDDMSNMMKNVSNTFARYPANSSGLYDGMIPDKGTLDNLQNLAQQEWEEDERHHLHIYSHKHNTHITLSKPDRNPLISVSCGNIGFRKAGRGTYDAAYQLAAFVMSRIQDKGLLPQIQKLELVYRGFGPGREAVTKAILGSEGKNVRPLIVRLSDSTRLKFGGVRSKKPRRLG